MQLIEVKMSIISSIYSLSISIVFQLIILSSYAEADTFNVIDYNTTIVPAAQSSASEKNRKQGKDGVFTIGEIVVREKAVANIEDAATTTVITSKEIREHGDKTLDDPLRSVPGLAVQPHTKGHMRAKFRSFDQDKIAIFIDGIPLSDVYATDVDLSLIPVLNVSRVIVNRGVSSALYGTSGPGGSINVVTRKPAELFCTASAEYGLFNNNTLNASVGSPIGNFYYWLSATAMMSDGVPASKKLDGDERREWFDRFIPYGLYPNPNNGNQPYTFDQVTMPAKNDYLLDRGLINHNEYRKYGLSGRAGYGKGDQYEFGISSWYNQSESRTSTFEPSCYSAYSPSTGQWTDPLFEVDQSTVKKAALRNRAFTWPFVFSLAAAPYFYYDAGDVSVKATAFYTFRRAIQEGYASTDHSFIKEASQAGFLEPFRDIKNYQSMGVSVYPVLKLSPNNRLSFAFLWRTDTFKEEEQAISSAASPLTTQYMGSGAYPVQFLEASFLTVAAEDEMRLLAGRLRLTAGISYDAQFFSSYKARESAYIYNEAYMVEGDSMLMGTRDSFNPVFGAVFDALPGFLLLRTALSYKTRFPTLSEYDKITSEDYDYNLRPERALNGNAGFEFILFAGTLRLRTDYFHSYVRDRIEKIPGTGEPPVNIDKVVSQGIEQGITYRSDTIAGLLKVEASATYVYMRVRNLDDTPSDKVNKGELMELTPEHQLIFDFRLAFVNGTTVSLWGYSTFNQVLYAMSSRPDTNAAFSSDYFEAVRVHDPIIFNLRVAHIFMEHYTAYVMCKNLIDDYGPDPFNPGAGRMLYGGIEAKL